MDEKAETYLTNLTDAVVAELAALPDSARIQALNDVRRALHEVSPFRSEPVDFVEWVPAEGVTANDYNPNSVAPPEMELLRVSIMADGYTQPIVTSQDAAARVVIDGFHRNRVGKECADVKARVLSHLPVVQIRDSQRDRSNRIAATVRHNRARGKHRVDAMSDIVIELKRRNWSDERVAKELGMDPDEVLRLCQITGIADAFKDLRFSEAWEVDRAAPDVSGDLLSDVAEGGAPTGGRVFHTWEKWECYRAGFYAERPESGTVEEGEEAYRAFLADPAAFGAALEHVVTHWPYSCEHYLTNDRMNRIAWLGQAAAAHAIGMPACCRGGYHKLTDAQKVAADALALAALNRWLAAQGRPEVSAEAAGGRTEAELY